MRYQLIENYRGNTIVDSVANLNTVYISGPNKEVMSKVCLEALNNLPWLCCSMCHDPAICADKQNCNWSVP